MIATLVEQVAILATAIVLLGVPGASLVSLLRIRSALPDTLAAPAVALFGALVASVATFVQLAASAPVELALLVHGGLSVVLAAAALRTRRRRAARGDAVVPVARGWDRWTTVAVLVGAAFTWVVRGAIRLDGLYHVSLSRKLVELDSPTFGNVNRFIDGGPNPTYALPSWHAMVGWTGWLTNVDTVVAWEIMPVLVVSLGALAAAGLARVLLDTPRAAPLGAIAWVLMRILFARRELDGDAILFGAVPGQVVFELVLPVVFAAIAVAMWSDDRRVRRAALTAAVVGIALVVVYHANYVPYVAIVGVGYVAWWAVSGPFRAGQWRRTMVVGGVVALACGAFLGVVLPLLATLENFGNAAEDARIDYHLAETFGMTHIRGGHLYEMLGLPGLLALLATPVVAARWRSRGISVAAGGILAVASVCVVPPLYAALNATGSLTVGLRINHVIGILLVPMFAGAVLLLADAVAARGWSPWRTRIVAAAGVVLMVGAGVAGGYTRTLPDEPGYVVWIAMVALFAWRAVARLRGRRTEPGEGDLATVADDPTVPGAAPRRAVSAAAPGRLVAFVTLTLVVGLALPVGAISARRAVLKRDAFTAGTTQGDLSCLEGPVERAIQEIPEGSTVLSDPGTSFRVMALAPVYVVGDYKIWNSTTSDNRTVGRLAAVNRFFDSSATDAERLAVLEEEDVDYLLFDLADGRWLDEPLDSTERPTRVLEAAFRGLDRFADFQVYDGPGILRLIQRQPQAFRELAIDERAMRAAIPQVDGDTDAPGCNSYGLWRVDPTATEFSSTERIVFDD